MTISSVTKTTELVCCLWPCHRGGTVCSDGERSSTLSKFGVEKALGVFQMKECVSGRPMQPLSHTPSHYCVVCTVSAATHPCMSVQAEDKRKKGRKWVSHDIYYWAGTYRLSSGHDVPIYVWRRHSKISTEGNIFIDVSATSCSPTPLTLIHHRMTGWRTKKKLRQEMQDLKSFIVIMQPSGHFEDSLCFQRPKEKIIEKCEKLNSQSGTLFFLNCRRRESHVESHLKSPINL